MERTVRLMEFWSRLPVFRVVAETEHLPTAGKRLGLTAPALSRSIKLLEEAVGVPLFDREGRRIVLNPAGRAFLGVVRHAMRTVDSGLDRLRDEAAGGPIRISSSGMFTPLAVAATVELRRRHPGLRPKLTHLWDAAVPKALLQGDLDAALLQFPEAHPELRIEKLASCPYAVYCGLDHPLAQVAEVAPDLLAKHAFVAPPSDSLGRPSDGWPPEVERTVAMEIVQVEVAVRVCASGSLLAVLPVPVVEGGPYGAMLRRLPLDLIASTGLYAVTRRPLSSDVTPAERMIDAVRTVLPDSPFEEVGSPARTE